jgi:hypothetical protein
LGDAFTTKPPVYKPLDVIPDATKLDPKFVTTIVPAAFTADALAAVAFARRTTPPVRDLSPS